MYPLYGFIIADNRAVSKEKEFCYTIKKMNQSFDSVVDDIQQFFSSPNAYRSILILVAAILLAYFLSKYLAQLIIIITQKVAIRSDSMSDEAKKMKLRQIETYLSITVAIVRAGVVAVVAYLAWVTVSPASNSGVAAIGASTIFIVVAGQSLGTLLRDLTTGLAMITEQWFHVGDYIKVEPFMEVGGVVERFTLRYTKIRSLSGEVIWIHNQHMHAVHVTPQGLRMFVVDLFTRDVERARPIIDEIIKSVPSSAALTTSPLKVKSSEKWGENMWRISVNARTAPGREWLVEKYFVNAIKEVDEAVEQKQDKVFVYEPIARYADPIAEKKFKRAIRIKKDTSE